MVRWQFGTGKLSGVEGSGGTQSWQQPESSFANLTNSSKPTERSGVEGSAPGHAQVRGSSQEGTLVRWNQDTRLGMRAQCLGISRDPGQLNRCYLGFSSR